MKVNQTTLLRKLKRYSLLYLCLFVIFHNENIFSTCTLCGFIKMKTNTNRIRLIPFKVKNRLHLSYWVNRFRKQLWKLFNSNKFCTSLQPLFCNWFIIINYYDLNKCNWNTYNYKVRNILTNYLKYKFYFMFLLLAVFQFNLYYTII